MALIKEKPKVFLPRQGLRTHRHQPKAEQGGFWRTKEAKAAADSGFGPAYAPAARSPSIRGFPGSARENIRSIYRFLPAAAARQAGRISRATEAGGTRPCATTPPTSERGSGAPARRWAAQSARKGAPRKRGPYGRRAERGRESLRRGERSLDEAPKSRGESETPKSCWRKPREQGGWRRSGGAMAGREKGRRSRGSAELPKRAGPGRKTGCDAPAEGAAGPQRGHCGAPGRRRGAPRKRGPRRLPARASGRESLRHDRYRPPPAGKASSRREAAAAGAEAKA